LFALRCVFVKIVIIKTTLATMKTKGMNRTKVAMTSK